MTYAGENVANFTQVRIPVYDDYGVPVDANAFAKNSHVCSRKSHTTFRAKCLSKVSDVQ